MARVAIAPSRRVHAHRVRQAFWLWPQHRTPKMLRRCFWKAEEAFKFLKTDPSLYQLVILPLHLVLSTLLDEVQSAWLFFTRALQPTLPYLQQVFFVWVVRACLLCVPCAAVLCVLCSAMSLCASREEGQRWLVDEGCSAACTNSTCGLCRCRLCAVCSCTDRAGVPLPEDGRCEGHPEGSQAKLRKRPTADACREECDTFIGTTRGTENQSCTGWVHHARSHECIALLGASTIDADWQLPAVTTGLARCSPHTVLPGQTGARESPALGDSLRVGASGLYGFAQGCMDQPEKRKKTETGDD